MMPFQLEASANPPCTSRMVGMVLDSVWSAAAAVEATGAGSAAMAATAAPVASALRRVIIRRTRLGNFKETGLGWVSRPAGGRRDGSVGRRGSRGFYWSVRAAAAGAVGGGQAAGVGQGTRGLPGG